MIVYKSVHGCGQIEIVEWGIKSGTYGTYRGLLVPLHPMDQTTWNESSDLFPYVRSPVVNRYQYQVPYLLVGRLLQVLY